MADAIGPVRLSFRVYRYRISNSYLSACTARLTLIHTMHTCSLARRLKQMQYDQTCKSYAAEYPNPSELNFSTNDTVIERENPAIAMISPLDPDLVLMAVASSALLAIGLTERDRSADGQIPR